MDPMGWKIQTRFALTNFLVLESFKMLLALISQPAHKLGLAFVDQIISSHLKNLGN